MAVLFLVTSLCSCRPVPSTDLRPPVLHELRLGRARFFFNFSEHADGYHRGARADVKVTVKAALRRDVSEWLPLGIRRSPVGPRRRHAPIKKSPTLGASSSSSLTPMTHTRDGSCSRGLTVHPRRALFIFFVGRRCLLSCTAWACREQGLARFLQVPRQ